MSRPGKFAVADRLLHHQYGTGTVAAVDSTYIVIDFDKNGRRKFVTSVAHFDASDVSAPAPAAAAAKRSRAAKPKR